MICKKCGNQLNDGAQFCPRCGQKTENGVQGTGMNVPPNMYYAGQTVNTEKDNHKETKKKHTLPIVIVSILAAIIGVSALFVVFGSRSTNDEDTAQTVSITSSQEAEDELFEYMTQACELVSQSYGDVSEIMNNNEEDAYRKSSEIFNDTFTDLSELQQQATAISGLDTKMENAGKEFFSMLCNSQKTAIETFDFYADVWDLYENILIYRPQAGSDTTVEEDYNALYAWYVEAQEGYSAIASYPSCVESQWKSFENTMDLNEYIVAKTDVANSSVDYLRYFSALNLSERYIALEDAAIDDFFGDCLWGELGYMVEQSDFAAYLFKEMCSYAEMDQEERAAYEFEYFGTGKITLDYDAIDTIYPSLYNTYDAFLVIKTGCMNGSKTILIEVEIPGFTQVYKESVTLDTSYHAINIKPPALTGDLDLSSAKDAQIKVTISEQDGTLIDAKTFPVTIKSKYDFEWYDDEFGVATQDNILCFLTPESSSITELKRLAIEEISNMTGGQMESFPGYQLVGWNEYTVTYLQAAGLMRALYDMGVRYNMDVFSISGSNQHILLPEDVLEQGSGLCIETSLVIASALQSAGMHAFLVFPEKHAQVAVETWSGSGEYFLIETTALDSATNNDSIYVNGANQLRKLQAPDGPIEYMNSDEWSNYLSQCDYIVDCDDSRILGLTPFSN